MPNFGEGTRDFLQFPIYYYDVTYSMSLPVRGIGGAAGVIVNGWDPVNLVPSLAHVSAAGALSVEGTVTATGGLTDTELRATPVPVSGTVSTGGLTDVQLRATPVPISGTVAVTGTFYQVTQPVSIADPVTVSIETLPDIVIDASTLPLAVSDNTQKVANMLSLQALRVAQAGSAGFVPIETPAFLIG